MVTSSMLDATGRRFTPRASSKPRLRSSASRMTSSPRVAFVTRRVVPQTISKPEARMRVTVESASARPSVTASSIAPPKATAGATFAATPTATIAAPARATWNVARVG